MFKGFPEVERNRTLIAELQNVQFLNGAPKTSNYHERL